MGKFNHIENRLLKAKIELLTKSVFISTIALSVKHIISEDVPTAATNGTAIWYNPSFIEKQTTAELAGLIAHECWHIAFQHLFRRGGRDPVLYNVAGDYVINLMLVQSGFKLPKGGLLDQGFEGMHTEAVYDALLKDADKQPAEGEIMLDLSDAPIGADKEGVMGAPDPNAVRDILVRAQTQSKLAGKDAGEIPGEISRIIEDLVNPKLPWEALLQKFLTNTQKVEYTWKRRNRRFHNYLPSMGGHGLGHLTFAIDTSGSESDEDLRDLLSEIQGIKDTFNPEKMTIIDCDSRINSVTEVDSSTDILSLTFKGGGGTSLHPPLEYAKENNSEAIIYFTDLYATTPDDPGIPVLWVCNSDHAPMPFGETIYIDP